MFFFVFFLWNVDKITVNKYFINMFNQYLMKYYTYIFYVSSLCFYDFVVLLENVCTAFWV